MNPFPHYLISFLFMQFGDNRRAAGIDARRPALKLVITLARGVLHLL
jgi:hypothetical protein